MGTEGLSAKFPSVCKNSSNLRRFLAGHAIVQDKLADLPDTGRQGLAGTKHADDRLEESVRIRAICA